MKKIILTVFLCLATIGNMQAKNYNMKVNIIIRLLLAIILLPTIAACDKDNNGSDAMHVDGFDILVRFESPIGTNILDSLNVQPTKEVTYNKLDDLYVNWKNKNDNFSSSSWYEPRLYWRHFPDSAYSHNPNFSYKGMGTILEMRLIDRNVSDSDYPKADEVYSITLKSKKIFGNDSPHTIKYYVHINGGGCGYVAKKCEVDGKDYPIIGPFSNLHPEWGMQLEKVLVVFKVNPSLQNNQRKHFSSGSVD